MEQPGMRPSRFGFGEGLVEAARKSSNIVALGSDITASVSMDFFAKEFPDRFFSLGIAEQNATTVAAGMALAGKIPFLSSYAVFSALRTTDQIRVSICYNNLHVIIGGAHAGISVGPDGATHQALEDIAIMRSLPNMTVLSPCDATQARLAVLAATEQISGPCYIRYGREPMPDFSGKETPFEIGKIQVLREGTDLTIVATGHLVWEALVAAEQLAEKGISAAVLNMHTIKPIDTDTLVHWARKTGKVITAEEHQISGGMGSAVCEVLSEHYPVPVKRIGMPDCFGESGKPGELMEKYGMTAGNIVNQAMKFFRK
jgi:transketolase